MLTTGMVISAAAQAKSFPTVDEPLLSVVPRANETARAPVEQAAFRDALARLGAAVNIITTDGPAGRAGFTASAVCSVSDSPPTLLVCINRGSSVYPVFKANPFLSINTLASHHEPLSNLFAGKYSIEQRFAAADWETWVSGSPILSGAAASFDCEVTEIVSAGSHDILLCQVLALAHCEESGGLIYFGRRYHSLVQPPLSISTPE
ncbi:flavin reductase [Edaphovirga cremea]|uniref:flavin reductase n=1 Tax=Edaphovirga cremea TaxID=2267246 RepID=UPI001FE9BE29|nr:flavin reductase [Edaphovirga cremea]